MSSTASAIKRRRVDEPRAEIVGGESLVKKIGDATPERQWRMLHAGRWKFRRAEIKASGLGNLKVSECEVTGDQNTVHGTGNYLRGNNLIVHGDDNTVEGNDCIVYGNRTTLRGQRGYVVGSQSQMHGTDNVAQGHRNRQFTADGVEIVEAPADEQVLAKVMPKESQEDGEKKKNKWKLSLLDLEGTSRQPPRAGLECSVCMDAERDVAFEPCGHVCCCRECSRGLVKTTRSLCPQCRAAVRFSRILYF